MQIYPVNDAIEAINKMRAEHIQRIVDEATPRIQAQPTHAGDESFRSCVEAQIIGLSNMLHQHEPIELLNYAGFNRDENMRTLILCMQVIKWATTVADNKNTTCTRIDYDGCHFGRAQFVYHFTVVFRRADGYTPDTIKAYFMEAWFYVAKRNYVLWELPIEVTWKEAE